MTIQAAIPTLTAADLKSIRSFLGYTQSYDQSRLTAGESAECDRLVLVVNTALKTAEG